MFKRFLKETGIYSIWIRRRKDYLNRMKDHPYTNKYIVDNLSDIWAPARIQLQIGHIIDWSFDYWSIPDNGLWLKLYAVFRDVYVDKMLARC